VARLTDGKLGELCRRAVDDGVSLVKVKVAGSLTLRRWRVPFASREAGVAFWEGPSLARTRWPTVWSAATTAGGHASTLMM
jgi:hypothetical protein